MRGDKKLTGHMGQNIVNNQGTIAHFFLKKNSVK